MEINVIDLKWNKIKPASGKQEIKLLINNNRYDKKNYWLG